MRQAISVESLQRRKFWEDHLQSWQASGLSQAGYCREHGLNDKSFVYWKRRLISARVAVSLVEVPRLEALPTVSPSRPLRLMIGDRYGIEIGRGFDEQTLDRLLRVLEER